VNRDNSDRTSADPGVISKGQGSKDKILGFDERAQYFNSQLNKKMALHITGNRYIKPEILAGMKS